MRGRLLLAGAALLLMGLLSAALLHFQGSALGKLWLVRARQEAQFRAKDLRDLAVEKERDNYLPPVLSVAEAQKQVPFRISVPAWLPEGGQLLGVRVTQVKLQNRSAVRQMIRNNTKLMPVPSYGLGLCFQKSRIWIQGRKGAPSGRAGLGREPVELIAANGVRPDARFEAEWHRQNLQLFRLLTDEARKRGLNPNEGPGSLPPPPSLEEFRARAKERFPLLLKASRLHTELNRQPLELTIKDRQGEIRTLRLPKKERFVFEPDSPEAAPQFREKTAALLLTLRGKNLALTEKRSTSVNTSYRKQMERQRVRGVEVWLSGPRATPNAFWQEGGIDFEINNYQRAMSRAEVLRLIREFKGDPSR